jgi:hypothetical protein
MMLGAGDYLRDAAEVQLHAPIDVARVDPDQRSN